MSTKKITGSCHVCRQTLLNGESCPNHCGGCLMKMSKHTPGPWKVVVSTTRGEFVKEYRIRSLDEGMICEIGPVAQEANARLIAAAPEMLERLKRFLGTFIVDDCDPEEYADLEALIAKAEGN